MRSLLLLLFIAASAHGQTIAVTFINSCPDTVQVSFLYPSKVPGLIPLATGSSTTLAAFPPTSFKNGVNGTTTAVFNESPLNPLLYTFAIDVTTGFDTAMQIKGETSLITSTITCRSVFCAQTPLTPTATVLTGLALLEADYELTFCPPL